MAVAFIIKPGGSKEQLDAVVKSLGIDDASQMAEGQIVHVEAYDAEGNPIVLDVWESEQHFNDFAPAAEPGRRDDRRPAAGYVRRAPLAAAVDLHPIGHSRRVDLEGYPLGPDQLPRLWNRSSGQAYARRAR